MNATGQTFLVAYLIFACPGRGRGQGRSLRLVGGGFMSEIFFFLGWLHARWSLRLDVSLVSHVLHVLLHVLLDVL